jgi:hypothetical protein
VASRFQRRAKSSRAHREIDKHWLKNPFPETAIVSAAKFAQNPGPLGAAAKDQLPAGLDPATGRRYR